MCYWFWASVFAITVLIIAVLILKYIKGDFSYKDTIESEREYQRTRTSPYGTGGGGTDFVKRVVIKRVYDNTRIKYITKEVEI